jgi:salicylate hydroxylase
MHLEGREVAVIGAGIGGLAAALALGQRRARVTVFEQAPVLSEVGAGIQVAPNGVAVLEALGLRDAAEAVASAPSAVHLRDGLTNRSIARVPLGQAAVARYGRPYWQFHRADLLGVLASHLHEAGIELRLGTRVTRLEPGEEGVAVHVRDGTPGHFAVAIAADGVRSPVRAAQFGGEPARFTRHVAWRGLVPGGPEAPEETTVYMGPGRHLVAYPLRGGRQVNVVAVEERADWTEEGWTHPDLPEAVRRAFAGWAPEVERLLAGLTDTFLWGLFDHPPLPGWTRGRIALLGDACHPMVPFLAQGATMALEDAWVLAAELDLAADPAEGLAAYEDRRRARATRVQRAAARNGRLYHLREPARTVARLGLAAASRAAPGLLLGRFDWIYGADVVSAHATA